jgi:pentatricopeptide repeat protein
MGGARPAARYARFLVTAAALASAVVLAIARVPPAHLRAAADPPPRVAIFGIDAADWRVIDPLIAAGDLPTFARLKRVGSVGVIRSEPPLLSPIIWTTIATGREPEDHGVLDFMVDTPGGGQAPVNGGSRRVKAIWEMWSNANRNVLVTGWWATWPADHVRGVLVSDRIATPHLRDQARPDTGLVFPAARWTDVRPMLTSPEKLDYAALSRLIPLTSREFADALAAERQSTSSLYQNPIAHFRAALAATRSSRRISTELIRSVQPDLWAVYYELVDTTSHLFTKDKARSEAAIRSAYIEMDAALADAAHLLDPAALVLVISDHGFQPADAAIREDPADLTAGATAWHRPYGIAAVSTAGALAGTTAPPRFAAIGTITPLDVVPSLLAYGRLPVARDMPGRIVVLTAGAAPPAARIASYGAHDQPGDSLAGAAPGAKEELERLRALGYVTGASASSLARVNLGEILFRRGDARGATRELEAVLRVDPLNERASLWLARSYVALGRPDDALRVYDRMIQSAGPPVGRQIDPIVFLAATDLDLAERRIAPAAARLTRVPKPLERTPEVLVARGTLAEAQGQAAVAEREYRAALDSAPDDAEAPQRLVDLLLREARISQASDLTFRLARAYPSSPLHLSLAGEAALAGKRYADAERDLAAALALTPDAASVRVELARARLLAGRPADALDTLAGLAPSREVEALRGASLAARSDWVGAIGSFERAIAAGEPTPGLLNALGHAQLRAGRAADAVRTLERSLALKPDQPQARELLGTARKQLR